MQQPWFFDIEGILRARRLDWVGKTLRTTIPSLAREVLVSRAESNLATKHCQEGSILMDAPPHTTMHQLMALAEDKPRWMKFVQEIHSPQSRKSSYTRRTRSLRSLEKLKNGTKELKNYNSMSDSKQQKAKRVSNDQKSRPNPYTSPGMN